MQLRKRIAIDKISEYVQENARYSEDAPKLKYSCRHPHAYGTNSVFSNDTWDLVVQLAKIYNPKALDKELESAKV